ncbi:MAG: hypothetical protein ACE5JG_12075, partial [Planctomycetota bacterium]
MRALGVLLVLAAAAAADRVVLGDGTVLTGTVTRAEGASKIEVGRKRIELGRVLLWEDDEGKARYAPDLQHRLRAYRWLAGEETLRRCTELLPRAIEEAAAGPARELLERAEESGLDPDEAMRWRSRIDRLEPAAAADPGIWRGPRRALPDLLLARARAEKGADEDSALRLLRAALRRDPGHAAARAWLKELAPRKWRIGDARTWLDWQIEILSKGVRFVPHRHPQSPRLHPDLGRAMGTWERLQHARAEAA